MARIFRLGTRRSLLALAQSGWVARRIEALNPGVKVELVGMETQGDRIQDIPLQKVEGKDFFVAELDQALLTGKVDLTVHSMKDLSLERPAALIRAAVPVRENPRDVVLLGPSAEKRIREGKPLRIGTSSPRRLENLPPFLSRALPRSSASQAAPALELVEIRGNVNTRLARVHESEDSERYLDGVVLAFAGLIRLWADEAGKSELERLLSGVRWMILPLRQCPAAPAQGALAVECRADDSEVREALAKLHHEPSARRAARERELLAQWGGGCHQKFGATCVSLSETAAGSEAPSGTKEILYIRGVKPGGEFVEEARWDAPPREKTPRGNEPVEAWDGTAWRFRSSSESTLASPSGVFAGASEASACFVAHYRALTESGAMQEQWREWLRNRRVWVSGPSSWFQLAERGVWVEGCAEGLGFEFARPMLAERVLQLPEFRQWIVLTHEGGREGWEEARAVATYRQGTTYPEAAKEALRRATHIYWSSGSQWKELGMEASLTARHACGPGKTADQLREHGISPLVFPGVEEWRKWVAKT